VLVHRDLDPGVLLPEVLRAALLEVRSRRNDQERRSGMTDHGDLIPGVPLIIADEVRCRRECRDARRALSSSIEREISLATRFFEQPDLATHSQIDEAIDARLFAQARLEEWSA
jgi:hypothetical protein